jgi:hypothetical protein
MKKLSHGHTLLKMLLISTGNLYIRESKIKTGRKTRVLLWKVE